MVLIGALMPELWLKKTLARLIFLRDFHFPKCKFLDEGFAVTLCTTFDSILHTYSTKNEINPQYVNLNVEKKNHSIYFFLFSH